jgi:hypothetical protein
MSLPRSDRAGHCRTVSDQGSRAHGRGDGSRVLRVLVELCAHIDVYDPMTENLLESYDDAFTLSPRAAAVLIGYRR